MATFHPTASDWPYRDQPGTRGSFAKWREDPLMVGPEYLWPRRFHERLDTSPRQNGRVIRDRVGSDGLWCALNAADKGHPDIQERRATCAPFSSCSGAAREAGHSLQRPHPAEGEPTVCGLSSRMRLLRRTVG